MEELEKLKLARLTVAPVWGHGLKSVPHIFYMVEQIVAPVWGHGLKSIGEAVAGAKMGRPRMG